MDFFSRQRSVPDWHQPLIEEQRALVLGVGGVGCTVARELCRLGVGEVVVLDNDVVSVSNLNRQVLYCGSDVGQRKVDVALEALHRDILCTRVSGVHCDAVKEWGRVVSLAKNATVVFNCIDYGEYFDTTVTSLCVSLGLPYLSASSYGHTGIAECYPPHHLPQCGPCWVCNNAPGNKDIIAMVTPDKVAELDNVEFLPQDSYMPTNQQIGSSVLPCTLAATLTVGAWLNALHGYTTPHWISCDFAMFQLYSYRTQPNPQCPVCLNAPRYGPLTVDVYFGTEKVSLAHVKGTVEPFTPGAITNPVTQSHIELAKSRLESVYADDDKAIFLPAVPASQLEYCRPKDHTPLPCPLNTPMVKSENGLEMGLRSGGRSAIIPLYRGCFRLKGCGTYVDASSKSHIHPVFPLLKIQTCNGGFEIRGCCFQHTVHIEQYMSQRVNELLLEHNITVGNRPIGFWSYTIPKDPISAIPKFCGLFETLGERRVSSHLLPGLEGLVPLFFPAVTQEEVWSIFPAERRGEVGITSTWSACCTGASKSSPVEMDSVKIPETTPSCTPPDAVPLHLQVVWIQATFTLRQALEQGITLCSLLALLYRRVGWEMGMVKQVLEKNQINWGYFFDHNPFEPHCNAHPNNFVVLPPGQPSLLAPVDFDLSFEERGFFSPYNGSPDQSLFDSWLKSEHAEMERAVAGETANTGVQVAATHQQEMSTAHKDLCWAFRDTLLLGYRAGYSGEEQVTLSESSRGSVDSLIRMALLLTHSAIS